MQALPTQPNSTEQQLYDVYSMRRDQLRYLLDVDAAAAGAGRPKRKGRESYRSPLRDAEARGSYVAVHTHTLSALWCGACCTHLILSERWQV